MRKMRLIDLPIDWKRGNGLTKSDIVIDGNYKCVLYGELFTKHKQVLIDSFKLSRTNQIGSVKSQYGDILVPGTSTAAKRDMILARELDEEGVFLGGDINIIRPHKNLFAKKFVAYYFETIDAYEQLEGYINGATGIIHISNTGLKNLKIPLPPLSEQEEIVSKLDNVFESIERAKSNAEQNLKNAKELFESVSESIFLKMKEEYGTVSISSICKEIFAGGDAPKTNFSDIKTEKFNVPIIANAAKNNGLYGFTDIARVNEPSITIAARGSGTGLTEIRYEPFLPIVRLIVLIPNSDKVSIDFLKYSIRNLNILSSGSAIPQLTVPMIKEYSVSIPSLIEQNQITVKLNSLSDKITELESLYQQKLIELEELKKSILQKAFNGELKTSKISS